MRERFADLAARLRRGADNSVEPQAYRQKARLLTVLGYFQRTRFFSITEIARATDAQIHKINPAADVIDAVVNGGASLDEARPGDLTFYDNSRYLPALARCRAAACFLKPGDIDYLPATTVGLIIAEPGRHDARDETSVSRRTGAGFAI